MADDEESDAERAERRERARRRRAREAKKAEAEKAEAEKAGNSSAPPSSPSEPPDVGDEASSIEGGEAVGKRKWSLEDVVAALRTRTRVLEDGNPYVNDKLLRALAKVGAKAVPPLLELLKEPRWTSRWAALSALQRVAMRDTDVDSKKLLPPLVEALADEKWRVRAKAVEALAALRKAKGEVLSGLIKALGDSNSEVSRLAVMHVLELGLDAKELTERMVEVLTTKRSVYLRVGALLVLLHLGKSAKAAVPDLIEAIEDPSPEVREYANLALTAIRTPSMRLQVIRTASMRLKAVEPASEVAKKTDDEDDDEDDDESDAKDAKDPKRRPLIKRKRRRLR